MHQTSVANQHWVFNCSSCGHRWSIDYEVHHLTDATGGDYLFWYREGLPSMAPANMPCPRCAELRVAITRPTLVDDQPS